MAFKGKDSKKNALERGVDSLGRINYFSRKKKHAQPTSEEVRPLRGAIQEIAVAAEAIEKEEEAKRGEWLKLQKIQEEKRLNNLETVRAQVEEEAKSLAETQFRNIPVEVKVDGDSFTSLYEEDYESYDAVTYYNFAGKAFLGSGEDKVVLDIRHTSSSTSQDPANAITSTVFYYKDTFVKDARDLYSKILEEGS